MNGQAGKMVRQLFLIGAFVLVSSWLGNQQKANDRKEAGIELITVCGDESDLQFLIHVAEFNMEEVLLGQLAQQKSKITAIQEMGKMMEETHSRSFMDLKKLSKEKELTIPSVPNHKARWTYKKLSRKSEKDFNIAYSDLMVEDHKNIIARFEKELKRSVDGEITEWARATLPSLRARLTYALTCQKKVKINADNSTR
jgi:putative membrane protein